MKSAQAYMSACRQPHEFIRFLHLILDPEGEQTQPLIQVARTENPMETRPASRDLLLM